MGQSRNENILENMLGAENELAEPQSRVEELLIDIYNQGTGLPEVDSDDNGKVLAVVNGDWNKSTIPSGNLPPVSDADDGKVLRVSGGEWGESILDDITGSARVLSQFVQTVGFLNSSGVWKYTDNSGYKHIVISVKGGETLKITSQTSKASYLAALKTYSVTADESADFSTASGWTGRKQVNSNSSGSFTLPSDARYLYLAVLNGGSDITPVEIILDDINLKASTTADALREYTDDEISALKSYTDAQDANLVNDAKIREINLFGVDGVDAPIIWELGSVNANSGVGYPVPDYASTTRWRGKGILNFAEPLDVVCDPTYYYQVYLLDSFNNLESTAFNSLSSNSYTIPAKTPFRIVVGKRDDSDLSSVDITQYITVKFNQIKEMINDRYHNGVKWCAMGDSITEGYYSYLDDEDQPTYAKDSEHSWATRVSEINRWELTNLGDGGTGWFDEDEYGGCAYKLARNTDFTPFNLVTLAFGINDWKGNKTLGSRTDVSQIATPTTVIEAMQITIETILADNPKCKVIGILPINCSRFGSKSDNWSLGEENTQNKTLEEFVQAMISIYEYYGIQYIDMAHASCVNRENIEALLIDGVHPSLDAHELMAHELSKKITF